MSDNKKVNLAAPWVIDYRKIEALFREDKQIKVVFDEDTYTTKIYVDNEDKAEALKDLLPSEKKYGNVIMKIIVVPANKLQDSKIALFRRAFSGNPAVSFIETINVDTNDMNFIVFQPVVVQFFNDSTADIHGLCSTLYQDIAKDIFGEQEGIFFSTDKIFD